MRAAVCVRSVGLRASVGVADLVPFNAGFGRKWSVLGSRGVASKSKDVTAKFSDPSRVAQHDASYKTAEVVAQRAALMAALGLCPGDRVVDIGCGTGFLLRELAGAVGTGGQAVGVEPAEEMRKFAAEKVQDMGHVSIREGNAYELPCPDASFDAAVFSQVLLYVSDVPRALQEAKRALRPGGRLVILDTDWGSLIVNTKHRERFEVLRNAFGTHFHDAHLPPKLPGLLDEAGLQVDEVRTIPMLASGSVDPIGGTFMGNWAFTKVPAISREAGVDEGEIDGWLREQQDLCKRNAFFACVHRFVFLARKS